MSKKSGPVTPDYTAAAEKQGEAALALNEKQTEANRPNMITPWGSQTWTRNGDQWTGTTTLSPGEQSALDSQQAVQLGRSQAAEGLLDRASDSFSQPIDWGSMPARAGEVQPFGFGDRVQSELGPQGEIRGQLNGTPTDFRNRAQEATWELQRPAMEQSRESMRVQLANQGLAPGSEAYNREMNRLDDSEARARLMAIDSGRVESAQIFGQELAGGQFENQAQAQGFGQDLTGGQFNNQSLAQQLQMQLQAGQFNNMNRQGAIAEQVQQRQIPLNELNALLTGQQVSMPTMPGFTNASQAQAPQYMDAAQMTGQAGLDRYNAQMGLFGNLAGAGASAFAFSDARLKEDIRPTGDSVGGVPVVEYRYRGLPGLRVGVIAQDVLRVKPSAVVLDSSGFYKVNYSELCA
jgi:hypothetical protein